MHSRGESGIQSLALAPCPRGRLHGKFKEQQLDTQPLSYCAKRHATRSYDEIYKRQKLFSFSEIGEKCTHRNCHWSLHSTSYSDHCDSQSHHRNLCDDYHCHDSHNGLGIHTNGWLEAWGKLIKLCCVRHRNFIFYASVRQKKERNCNENEFPRKNPFMFLSHTEIPQLFQTRTNKSHLT